MERDSVLRLGDGKPQGFTIRVLIPDLSLGRGKWRRTRTAISALPPYLPLFTGTEIWFSCLAWLPPAWSQGLASPLHHLDQPLLSIFFSMHSPIDIHFVFHKNPTW